MSVECLLGLTPCISQYCCYVVKGENITIPCCYGTRQTRDLMNSPRFLWYLKAVQHLAIIALSMGENMGEIATKSPSCFWSTPIIRIDLQDTVN